MTSNAVNINDDGLVIFNSTTGQFSAVELTSKGDILTRTTSIYTSKSVGTDGHVLTSQDSEVDGLLYASKSSGSSVVFLESQTASSSSSIDFDSNWDDSTYMYYIFTLTNVRPSTDGVELRVRMSIDGGAIYESSDYRWVRKRLSSSSGSDGLGASDSDSKTKIVVDLGNAAGEGLSGKAIYIPSSSPSDDNAGHLMHDNTYVRDSGTMFRNFGKCTLLTNSVVNGIRWYMSSGNVATGIFKMYGVTKA